MENAKLNNRVLLYSVLICGISFIIGLAIFANAFYNSRHETKTLEVTGSAKKVVSSDVVKWGGTISRIVTVNELKTGSAQIRKDEQQVEDFFGKNGIDKKDLTVSPVFVYDIRKQEYNSGETKEKGPVQYSLNQYISIQSKDIDKVVAMAKDAQQLLDSGIMFLPNELQYYYSKLSEARIELLGAATQDAKQRAEKIASSSGSKVGNLQSASVSPVQVLPVNSTEVSDYGAYDTSTRDKEITVTIKAYFALK